MRSRGPTLIDILKPRQFATHPKRTAVTRTVRQPDFDEFEKIEGLAAGKGGNKARKAPSPAA